MSSKSPLIGRVSVGHTPAEKASSRPARNAKVGALNKHVNESDRYSVESVHKAFGKAMTQAKAKAKG